MKINQKEEFYHAKKLFLIIIIDKENDPGERGKKNRRRRRRIGKEQKTIEKEDNVFLSPYHPIQASKSIKKF